VSVTKSARLQNAPVLAWYDEMLGQPRSDVLVVVLELHIDRWTRAIDGLRLAMEQAARVLRGLAAVMLEPDA